MLKRIPKKTQVINMGKNLKGVAELMPKQDILQFFNVLTQAYRESQLSKVELSKIEAQRDIALLEIKNKYELYQKVFDSLFDERKMAIDKSFELIDDGLASGDKDLVNAGMQGLSKIVSSSPFENIRNLSQALEGETIIEI